MIETWLPVTDYEGIYEVSNLGQVRSLDRLSADGRKIKGRILTPMWQGGDVAYAAVALHVNRIRDVRKVHHLVLEAFVGPRPDGLEGLHNDDNRKDNSLANLRWGTRSENQRDCVRNGHNHHARKTKCRNGHEGMLVYRGNGRERRCRQCDREQSARYRAKIK